jgi:hypothetical protein
MLLGCVMSNRQVKKFYGLICGRCGLGSGRPVSTWKFQLYLTEFWRQVNVSTKLSVLMGSYQNSPGRLLVPSLLTSAWRHMFIASKKGMLNSKDQPLSTLSRYREMEVPATQR